MSVRSLDAVRWSELDGLRALAILLVLARHSLRPFISEDGYVAVITIGSFDLTPLFLNGWVGVDLFFVLSGFLIGRQALRGEDGLARFWFKRVTRILPAYWTCLAMIALWLTVRSEWEGSTWHYVAHVVMMQDYTGSVFVPAFWSLGAEEKFYLLTPLLALALGAVTRRWMQMSVLLALWTLPICARALAVAGGSFPVPYIEYFSLYRSPFHLTFESLVVGFAVAWLTLDAGTRSFVESRRWLRELLFWGGAASVLGWLGPGLILGRIDGPTIIWAPALVGLGFGLMVLACVSGTGSHTVLLGGGRWRALSTWSYTLYLTHMMMLPVAVVFGSSRAGETASVASKWLAFLPWYIALSLASALLLHLLVEAPVLRWRDRVLRQPDPPLRLRRLAAVRASSM